MDKLEAHKYTILIVSSLLIFEYHPFRRIKHYVTSRTYLKEVDKTSQVVFDLGLFEFQVFILSELMKFISSINSKIVVISAPLRQHLTIDISPLLPSNSVVVFLITAFLFLNAWDFFQYWSHRLMHLSLFWEKMHKFHHGTKMYALTSFRHHPFESIFLNFTITVPTSTIYAFAFPAGDFFIFWLLASIQSLALHSDLSFPKIPFLSTFFLTPNHHALHHDIGRLRTCNFGQYFTIWDRLFGTYVCPYQLSSQRIVTGKNHSIKKNFQQLFYSPKGIA